MKRSLLFATLVLLTGCVLFEPTEKRDASVVIGPEGGTLEHPSGANLVVPPGALDGPITLSITEVEAISSTELSATPVGPSFVLRPEGQQFHIPVVVSLPFDLARIPNGDPTTVRVFTAPEGSSDFVALAASGIDGTRVRAETVHFSSFVPAAPTDPNPIFITTAGLPGGIPGSLYGPANAEATGGTPPYAWSIGSGSLPPGLFVTTLGDGRAEIAGTPTTAGTWGFSLRVTGMTSAVERAYSIAIGSGSGNPLPSVVSVAPSAIMVGSGDTQVSIDGFNFVDGCYAFVGSTGISTLFQTGSLAQAVIPAAMLATPGTLTIGVFNPAPAGGASNVVSITVGSTTSLSITGLTPNQVTVGSPATLVTVTGNGFVSASAVTLDGTTLPTTFVDATTLTTTIPATVTATTGSHVVRVSNVLAGGGFSNTYSFTVVNVGPTITSMSPSDLPAGYGAASVTLTGTGFGAGGTVKLGAATLTTQVVSPTQAIVQVPANYLVNPGVFSITFSNPPPGPATSAPFPFPVVTPVAPTVLGSTPVGGYGNYLAVDDTFVYWTDYTNSTVHKVPIAGGPSATIAATPYASMPRGIATGACDVFWANTGNSITQTRGGIRGMPVNGGDPGEVGSTRGELHLVRYDPADNSVYWTTGPDIGDVIWKASLGGGAPTLAGGGSWIQAFEMDADNLYVVNRGTGPGGFYDGSIAKLPKSGVGGVTLASWQNEPRALAVGSGRVYWSLVSGEIRSIDVSGAGGVSVVATAQGEISSMAIDGTYLYWTTGGDVRAIPLAGGSVRVLAYTPGATTRSLVVDGHSMYWLRGLEVVRLAKPGGSGGPPATSACASNPGWSFPVLLSNVGGWGDLATDGADLFWTDGIGSGQGRVFKLPVSGGVAPTVLASGQESPSGIALLGSSVYWANHGPQGAIMRIDKSGSPSASALYSGQPNVRRVAVHPTAGMWWISEVNRTVVRNGQVVAGPYPGGNQPTIPFSVQTDGTFAYWYAYPSLWKLPVAAPAVPQTPPTKVADGTPADLLASNVIYFFEYPGMIKKMDLAVGPPAVTILTGQANARNLTLDTNGDLYFLTDGLISPMTDGKVKRLRAGATTADILVDGQSRPLGLAIDATHVYWMRAGGEGVAPEQKEGMLKLAKNARP